MPNTAQELANDRYKDLCAQLADKVIQRKMMDKDIAAIENQIEALNSLVPLMHRLEDQVTRNLTPVEKKDG